MDIEREGWERLIAELTAERPRESEIKLWMKNLGLKPRGDLIFCMELALKALEDRQRKNEVENEVI